METRELFVLGLVGAGLLAGGIALGFSLRRRKGAAERERERRLKINTIGRLSDGAIEKLSEWDQDGRRVSVLHFHYAVSGVAYAAAQDVSTLRHVLPLENCGEGVPISVKYDPQNPTNSIVACELWSGLR